MSSLYHPHRPGHYARLLVITLLLALLIGLSAGPTAAQDTVEMTGPTATEAEPGEAPIILSDVRSGDVRTITIEIRVGADTFTTSGRPNTNWSNATQVRVGFNNSLGYGAQRTFMFWDLSSIPANAVIQNATMEVHLAGASPANDPPVGIQARFLSSPWDPTILTWNNFNPSWGAEIGIGQVPSTPGIIQANFTNVVREWVTGARPNFGVMFQGLEDPVAARERIFWARDANNGLHPRLRVTYDVDVAPPTSSMTALPAWSRPGFTVTWSGVDNPNPGGTGIRHFDVQSRANGGAWQNWLTATTSTSATFPNAQNGVLYEFRVRATDRANPPNVEAFPNTPQASTRVDSLPPVVSINTLPAYTFANTFTVSWSGADPQPGSGIAYFDVEFQLNGGPWQPFALHTTTTSGQVLNGLNGQTYAFRARGVDNVGNVQPHSPVPQSQSTISIANPTADIVPFPTQITVTPNFLVQWTAGTAGPGTSIANYDLRFRYRGGPWQNWLSATVSNSAVFTATLGDGIYDFQVRARDTVGRVGNWTGTFPGNSIVLDAQGPSIVPRTFIPFVPRN